MKKTETKKSRATVPLRYTLLKNTVENKSTVDCYSKFIWLIMYAKEDYDYFSIVSGAWQATSWAELSTDLMNVYVGFSHVLGLYKIMSVILTRIAYCTLYCCWCCCCCVCCYISSSCWTCFEQGRCCDQRGVCSELSPGMVQSPSTFYTLKGLSHEIFTVIFWLEWIYLGLNENRYWFLNFKEGFSILDSYFKYWCVPYQTFSEIRRISEKDSQLSPWFSNFSFFWVSGPPRNVAKGRQYFSEILRISENDWQPIPRFSENVLQQHKRVHKTVLNPSRRFYKSPRRFVMKHTQT